jgi:6-pyruvoyl-tetrahydropterin synthase
MHGATFVVDVAFFRDELDPDNIVVDIGRATDALHAVLQPLRYANLDEHHPFEGRGPTTTEFLARHIFQEMALKVRGGELGPHASGLNRLRVTLNESHVARAWCEGPLA